MLDTRTINLLPTPVSDLEDVRGKMHQEVDEVELVITRKRDGCCNMRMTVKPRRFAVLPDGSRGAEVPAAISEAQPVVLVGNETTAVDPANGQPRYRRLTETYGEQPGRAFNELTGAVEVFERGQNWEAYLQAKPERLMLQDRYYGLLCARVDVNVADLMDETITAADAAPSRFIPAA